MSKPLAKFASQVRFGIQSSQDVKRSNIARSLQEGIPLIGTEKRLSRNLKSDELEKILTPQLVKMGSARVQSNTALALDLSDMRKEYAQKMENLAKVYDGSSGELHLGYWLCDVTAAEVNGSEIVSLYQKLFSVEAKDFSSENAEVPAAVDLIREHTHGRGIWTMDRGGDRKTLLEPWLERGQRFVRPAPERHVHLFGSRTSGGIVFGEVITGEVGTFVFEAPPLDYEVWVESAKCTGVLSAKVRVERMQTKPVVIQLPLGFGAVCP